MFIKKSRVEIALVVLGGVFLVTSFLLKKDIGFINQEVIRLVAIFIMGSFGCQILWKRKLYTITSQIKNIEEKQYEKKLEKVKLNNAISNIYNVAIDLFKESKEAYQNILGTSVEVADAMEGLNNTIRNMEAATDQIAATTDDLAEGSTEQLLALNNIVEAFHDIGSYLNIIKSSSDSSVKEAENSYESAKKGKLYIDETWGTMDKIDHFSQDLRGVAFELEEKTEKINKFVVTINSIADHTKLLALNSSIEAARAGEHGKGFAVVAKEVGNLAYQSQNASNDITKILQELTNKLEELKEYAENNVVEVVNGKNTVKRTNEVLHVIESNAQQTRNGIRKIRDHLDEIQRKNENIHKATNDIQTVSETNVAGSQELNAMLEEMTDSYKKIVTNTEGVTSLSKNLQESVAANAMEQYMYYKALNILNVIKNNNNVATKLKDLSKDYCVSDIYVVEANGKIIESSEEKAIGIDSFEVDPISKEASKSKEKYLATPIRRRMEDNEMYKFLHLPCEDGRVLTVSLSLDLLLSL